MSCVISYIFVSLIATVNKLYIHNQYLEEPLVISAISILLSCGTSVGLAKIYVGNKFHDFMVNKFYKSPNDDIWRDVFDYKNGTNLKVYLKETPYYLIGHYKSHEEKGNDSWFVLSAFSKIDNQTNSNYSNEPDFSSRDDILITIRLSDIEHIEIF
jgi:hypothetical protein